MAAYGALVSVMHIIEQLKQHPHPPITLDKQQAQFLSENIAFLQDFLEVHNSHYPNQEVERLWSRIADTVYAAEDIIESHIVDQIHAQSTRDEEKMWGVNFYRRRKKVIQKFVQRYVLHARSASRSRDSFYQRLHEVIEDMNSIKKEVVEIKEKMGNQHQLQNIITPIVSSRSPTIQQNTMVGFDDVLNEVLDKLTGQQSDRQIIPIFGMGGVGKTTLARNVYVNPLIEQYFDVRAWITISQEYDIQKILFELLIFQKTQENKESLSGESEQDLGLRLHKNLTGRRYLIIMDDMWDVEAWDKIKVFFPNNNNGSRIVVTTRLSRLAMHLTDAYSLKMNFLDEDKSWDLFCKIVFGEENCPRQFEEIGKKIVGNCKGLPLSIVVIGGLLAKSKPTQEYWEYITENLTQIVNLDDNERSLTILYTSYDQLPVHLKPCFLYMGIFPEDSAIRVSELIIMWVAEGFLKPINGKSLEESAEEYLMDLIDRNLILVSEHGALAGVKFCKIHDLLRDLCLREVRKEKFLCFSSQHSLNIPHDGINIQRRVVIHENASKEEYFYSLKSAPITRSLICSAPRGLPLIKFRLLRVLKTVYAYFGIKNDEKDVVEVMSNIVNLQYLGIDVSWSYSFIFPSSAYLIWNLQTLIVECVSPVIMPPEIWKMSQLRNVKIGKLVLPDPPSDQMIGQDKFMLWNLQTLLKVYEFNCRKNVVKRIPNVKKLKICYWDTEKLYCLENLCHLHKLESLGCFFYGSQDRIRSNLLQNLTFPHLLKKLTLRGCGLYWEDMGTKIGSLPHLQVLKLEYKSFMGRKWETVEGQFPSLKYLLVDDCNTLENWVTESTHFPRLEHLILVHLHNLEEVPCGIGEISTLKSIELKDCGVSANISAQKILEEQEEFGNEGLQVKIWVGESE